MDFFIGFGGLVLLRRDHLARGLRAGVDQAAKYKHVLLSEAVDGGFDMVAVQLRAVRGYLGVECAVEGIVTFFKLVSSGRSCRCGPDIESHRRHGTLILTLDNHARVR
jgi:hypothetical protein